ncbi:MAG TPA: MATE family efflux transporter, partial [Thermoanaerobaculia bacterium]|nr:MATE family efflux transporter [Thermoanaerobaculia bacterium]
MSVDGDLERPSSFGVHLRRLLALAVPSTIAQFGAMLLMVVDVLMLGRVSVEALDSASLGRVWALGTMVAAMGLVFGIDPVATQAWGSGNRRRYEGALGSGIAVALLTSVPIGALWLLTGPSLRLLGQEPELTGGATQFVLAQLPGLPFLLVFIAAKQYLQAQGSVLPAMWVTLVGNALNVGLNWLLIFGRGGLPALGVFGSGIATSITHAFLAAALLLWMRWRGEPGDWRGAWQRGRRRRELAEVVGYGWPVATQLLLEVWTFQVATLLAGRLGAVALAAHTAAISLASVTFTVPFGVSLAAVVRVGNLMGARARRDAQRAAWVALGAGAGVMSVSALGFWVGRYELPKLFSAEPAVIAAAAAILPIAAAFQVFDGLQVVGCGVLRGMGQTRPAALFNVVGYYGLALPLAWWLGFRMRLGLSGIWWGLALGLASVAVLLLVYIRRYGPATLPPGA